MDFLDPLKPFDPADDQAITLPLSSEIVTIVLLNVALTKAIPEVIFFLIFFFGFFAFNSTSFFSLLLSSVIFFFFIFVHLFIFLKVLIFYLR